MFYMESHPLCFHPTRRLNSPTGNPLSCDLSTRKRSSKRLLGAFRAPISFFYLSKKNSIIPFESRKTVALIFNS